MNVSDTSVCTVCVSVQHSAVGFAVHGLDSTSPQRVLEHSPLGQTKLQMKQNARKPAVELEGHDRPNSLFSWSGFLSLRAKEKTTFITDVQRRRYGHGENLIPEGVPIKHMFTG